MVRDLLDHAGHRPLARGLGVARRADRQAHRGEDRGAPGAEVLGREVLARRLLDVGVDVGGLDVDPPAAVPVGEQLVDAAAPALEALDHAGDLGVDDVADLALAVLGRVVEDDEAVDQADVVLAHRRQAIGLVLDGVVLGADAEEAAVEQAHGGGEHALAAQVVVVGALEVALDAGPHAGQRAGEAQHVVELLLVAALAPGTVVQVLLAPAGVEARRLDVTARVRADPHVLPRRRDDEVVDAREDLGVVDALAVGVDVDEPAARAAAADARAAGVRAAQPDGRRARFALRALAELGGGGHRPRRATRSRRKTVRRYFDEALL